MYLMRESGITHRKPNKPLIMAAIGCAGYPHYPPLSHWRLHLDSRWAGFPRCARTVPQEGSPGHGRSACLPPPGRGIMRALRRWFSWRRRALRPGLGARRHDPGVQPQIRASPQLQMLAAAVRRRTPEPGGPTRPGYSAKPVEARHFHLARDALPSPAGLVARLAEWQTQRAQTARPQGVGVQIPRRAPSLPHRLRGQVERAATGTPPAPASRPRPVPCPRKSAVPHAAAGSGP